jgi:hypothetical protein
MESLEECAGYLPSIEREKLIKGGEVIMSGSPAAELGGLITHEESSLYNKKFHILILQDFIYLLI